MKPTINGSPWARAAMDPEALPMLEEWARGLGVSVSCLAKEPKGPFVVTVWNRDKALRFGGHGSLAAIVAFGLERWAAGADDTGIRWIAGADKLAHGHRGPRQDTLCGLPWTDDKFAHEERSRCNDCWRALDRKFTTSPGSLSERTLIAAYGGLPGEGLSD